MEKLKFYEKAGYGIGEVASNIIWQTVMFFLPIFYTDVFGISAAAVGTMFMVVRFFDAFNDPIMGTIADRTNSRWGKYRPYVLFMALPYGIAGILMFSTPDLSYTGKVIFAYITYITMMVVYTAMMIPFSALSGVMTSDYLDRTSLNSWRFVGAFVGGLFIQGLALMMVAQFGEDNESIVVADIKSNEIVLSEVSSGTTILTVQATDSKGESVSQDVLVRVFRKGENSPIVISELQDTLLKTSESELVIPVKNVFKDIDGDELEYRVKSTLKKVATVEYEDGDLKIEKKGAGFTTIQITADDGNGGEVTTEFEVQINSEGNTNPVVASQLPAVTFNEVFEKKKFDLARKFGIYKKEEIDVSSVFSDTDGDELFLTATSNNNDVVAATVIKNTLVIKKKSAGVAGITLTADDGKGGKESTDFEITVATTGNTAPVVAKVIDKQYLKEGFGTQKISLAGVFADYENDNLTYSFVNTNNAKGYKYTMSIFAILCIFLFLVTFFTSKERVKPVSLEKSKLSDDLSDLMKNKPWIILFVVSLITLIYVAIRSSVIAYYFQYYVGDPALTAAFLVIGSIVIIAVLPLTKWLTEIFDKRLLYVICMVFVGLSLVFYQLLGPDDILWMFVLQILQSLGSAATMPLLWSMLADSADYSEWKTGRKAMGLAYSASTLAQKIGFGIGGAIALWLLAYFGYQPNAAQSVTSLNGMKLMMGLLPAMGAFLCAVLIWFYSLDSKMMVQISVDLKERREAAGIKED